jgi:hypothetical protein
VVVARQPLPTQPIVHAVTVLDAGPPAPLPQLVAMEDLAANAASVAPGMHELARRESESLHVHEEAGQAREKDLCVRVLFAATSDVRATLENAKGEMLVETTGASRGVLGPRGPVCVRKGETLFVRIDADEDAGALHTRFIVWGSP